MIGEQTEKKYKEMIKMYGYLMDKSIDEIIEGLKGMSDGSQKNVLSAFRWETMSDKYDKKIKEINKKVTEKQNNTNKFKKIDWSKIEEPTGNTVDDVIKGIYTMFPPRRIEDYVYMCYIENEEEEGDENYYIEGRFIFKKYKTSKRYGRQEFKVSDKLKELIDSYIKMMNITSGETLLQYKYDARRGTRSDKTLRNKLMKIFGVSVDGLRHAYITEIHKDPKNLYKLKEISDKMAHSIGVHMTYLDKENN